VREFFNYMHAGVPSINMDFPVYSRYCSEDAIGLCIPDMSERTMNNAILPLLKDESRYQAMVTATISAQKKYSWQKEEKRLIGYIDEMMKR